MQPTTTGCVLVKLVTKDLLDILGHAPCRQHLQWVHVQLSRAWLQGFDPDDFYNLLCVNIWRRLNQ